MRLGFLSIKNLGFQNKENKIYIKNYRDNKWAIIIVPNNEMLRGKEAFKEILLVYSNFERRSSGDPISDSTNVFVDVKLINENTQIQRIRYSFVMSALKKIGLTLPDIQFHQILLEAA
jgi:hypothetical protein